MYLALSKKTINNTKSIHCMTDMVTKNYYVIYSDVILDCLQQIAYYISHETIIVDMTVNNNVDIKICNNNIYTYR